MHTYSGVLPAASRALHWFSSPERLHCIPFTQTGNLGTRREAKAKPDPHTVHSLSGIKVCAGAKRCDPAHLIAEQQVRGAAGNMEQQNFFSKQLFPLSCKQRCGSVTLLMGRQHKWDPFCMCKGRCSIDTCKKARHIAAFYRAGLLRYAHSIDLRQIKFLRQFLHHLRQRDRMMKQCIALPQAQLARFYRQKALLCANNLSSCIKHCQRGCIVACINAKRITAHCSACSASRP